MQIQSPPHSLSGTGPLIGARYDVRSVSGARNARWGWPEAFIAIQLLWGIVLFLPGAQAYRTLIRALPYVVSGAALVYCFRNPTGEPMSNSAKWLVACFVLLVLNLLQPSTHFLAGVGQIVFQISIAAPAFWMARAIRSERRLITLVWALFASSLVASSVGVLQVYFPDRFLPPEFSTLAQTLNPDIVSSLTYQGADGRAIIRPPGLSDLPGGASVAGMMTAILGLTLALQRRQAWYARAICLAAVAIGMTVLFLTQVRALVLLAVASVAITAALRLRKGRTTEAAIAVVVGVTLLAGAWVWAVSVGGEAVSDRFLGLVDNGVIDTFERSRGAFLKYTLSELVYEFPLGAGLGRWGVMHVLFGDPTMWQAPPIHVEVQPTGWLLDGGVPLLVLYVGALAAAVRFNYRVLMAAQSERMQGAASVVLCVQITLIALCLSGAVFNNQLGIQFWSVTGALVGAGRLSRA